MEFKLPYAQAMRQQAPQMFIQLCRANLLDKHLQQKSQEAHQMLDQLLGPVRARHGRVSMAQEREAEEIVRATMIDFPHPPDPAMLEPPEDLPHQTPASKASTTRLHPAQSRKPAARP